MAMGMVYLVGAGPGDPSLITVRGLECIRTADVLVYDRLVSPALVAQVRPGCDLVYAGKECGRHDLPQEEINALLLRLALEEKVVCRLKGGDPFVYGRGGEEAEMLAIHNIPFEVVPGLTAGIAAPAYAGIPITHRNHASSVCILTGYESLTHAQSAIEAEPQRCAADTLLIYMGMRNIARLVEQILAAGRSPATPIAVIHWGTTAGQQTVSGTLATICEAVSTARLQPPAMIVVGAVAALRERLAWAERRPLHGRRVLVPITAGNVAQSTAEERTLSSTLRRLGAEVWEWPVPRQDLAPLLVGALKGGAIQCVAFAGPAAVTGLLQQVQEPALLRPLTILSGDLKTAKAIAISEWEIPAEVGA